MGIGSNDTTDLTVPEAEAAARKVVNPNDPRQVPLAAQLLITGRPGPSSSDLYYQKGKMPVIGAHAFPGGPLQNYPAINFTE